MVTYYQILQEKNASRNFELSLISLDLGISEDYYLDFGYKVRIKIAVIQCVENAASTGQLTIKPNEYNRSDWDFAPTPEIYGSYTKYRFSGGQTNRPVIYYLKLESNSFLVRCRGLRTLVTIYYTALIKK